MLEPLLRSTIKNINTAQKKIPIEILAEKMFDIEAPRSFGKFLTGKSGVAVIAEIKYASPARGLLFTETDPEDLAVDYQSGGARAISVITEQHYFRGKPEYIERAKKVSLLPVLRKDFIISEYQVLESRLIGADALLLIVAILSDTTLRWLLTLTASLGMDALVEVHNRSELERAIDAGAKIIGINNRNLHTFQVNLSTTLELISHIPNGVLTVSESGISCRQDILTLQAAGCCAILIGEALVSSKNPRSRLEELLCENKKVDL